MRLQYERVSLGDLVSDAIAGSAPIAAAKGVKLEGRVIGPPPELMASAPEVLRVLRNLLENAIRHTPSDGSVVVEAGIDDLEPEHVYVEVRDTGGGVPEADLPHIFDVAFRSDRARTPGADPVSVWRSPRASSKRTAAISPSSTPTAAPASRCDSRARSV